MGHVHLVAPTRSRHISSHRANRASSSCQCDYGQRIKATCAYWQTTLQAFVQSAGSVLGLRHHQESCSWRSPVPAEWLRCGSGAVPSTQQAFNVAFTSTIPIDASSSSSHYDGTDAALEKTVSTARHHGGSVLLNTRRRGAAHERSISSVGSETCRIFISYGTKRDSRRSFAAIGAQNSRTCFQEDCLEHQNGCYLAALRLTDMHNDHTPLQLRGPCAFVVRERIAFLSGTNTATYKADVWNSTLDTISRGIRLFPKGKKSKKPPMIWFGHGSRCPELAKHSPVGRSPAPAARGKDNGVSSPPPG